ncbi:MAG: hypothetical protein Q8O89_02625 [Nanoarchaeota archaeon]|nr:hypothetical protein [Nanoarchaeota archaeon]
MNKKAQMMMSPRKSISLVLGFIMLTLGLIPVLKQLKVIKFSLPALPVMVVSIFLLACAIWLIYDAYDTSMGMPGPEMFMFGIIAVIVLALGLIPLLHQLKILPFTLPVFMNSILPYVEVAAGLALIIGGFLGM